MDLHLEIDRRAGGVTDQVTAGLRTAIRKRSLTAGVRLPASRQLAQDVGVSRGVIVEAYNQLIAEGFLLARPGAGTIVSECCAGEAATEESRLPTAADDRVRYQLRPGIPDLSLFPRGQWLARMRQALAALPHEALGYPDHAGVLELRRELASYLNRVRSARANPDGIVVVNGVSLALSLIVRVLAGEGRRRIAVEDPSGRAYQELLVESGAELVHVPVDDEGIDVSTLEQSGADAVILTPAHQFPTGVVLSPARRAALAAWALATGAHIVEDDYDAEFRFDRDPVGSLQGLLPSHVTLTGSVSKALSPGLRLGWMVAPPEMAQAVRRLRGLLDLGSPVLEQYTLARFLADGGYDRHLRRARKVYRRRRDALASALATHLPQAQVRGINAGLHLYAELPSHADDQAIAAAAQERGVALFPISPMRTAPGNPGLVIGFACETEQRLAEAVRLIPRPPS
ncbi:MAG TPA: GntR family transcriptional regulator [Micromonosporaceae bacterium]|nr:GntR family transcriptional regulator [Micromonosporaceae bacterium]HCU52699.1 GntR family transcriptional regulator [Micromonosporaceae bacterium]